jgi:hypothetical protein
MLHHPVVLPSSRLVVQQQVHVVVAEILHAAHQSVNYQQVVYDVALVVKNCCCHDCLKNHDCGCQMHFEICSHFQMREVKSWRKRQKFRWVLLL